MSFPYAVSLDAAGTLYIADSVNQRIRKVVFGTIDTVAGNGTRAFAGDGAAARSAALNQPQGLAVDADGGLYIADTYNSRVRKVGAAGMITTLAGSGQYKFSGDGAAAIGASLNGPQCVAVDSAGRSYVADTLNHRVRKINAAGVITTLAGNGTQGFSGDGGPAAGAALNSSGCVTLDAAGNAYVADTGNHRVRRVAPDGTITTLAGTGVVGSSGDGGPASVATLNRPTGVAADLVGNVYIADTGNHRIRKVTAAGVISTLAGNGAPGFSGDRGPAVASSLNSPAALCLDANGNLFFADTANHRVRKIDPGGAITTIAGTGVPGDSGLGGPAEAAQLNSPAALAVDAAGRLLIADTLNHRILKVAGGIIGSVAGRGVPGFAGDGGPSGSAWLNQPMGVAVDSGGNVFVADSQNDRVRKIFTDAPPFTVFAARISFEVPAGAPATGARLLDISSVATGLPWTAAATTEDGQPWLVLSAANGAVPGSVTVSVNVTGLKPGVYRGVITFAASGASPASRTVAVDLTVQAAVSPELTAEPSEMTIEASEATAGRAVRAVRIGNAGAGGLNWTAQTEMSGAREWLHVSPASGTAWADRPASLEVSITPEELPPGVYAGAVRITSSELGQSRTLTVILLVSQPAQTILLSQTGVLFTGVENGVVIPEQSFAVLNTGQGLMRWTVQADTLSGGRWLNVSRTSGDSPADASDIPFVDVTADPASLRAGHYSGFIRVRAPAANNSPQFVTVDMNVLPAGANPGVLVRPAGLVFVAREGESSPGSQTVRLATADVHSVEVRGGVFTLDGAGWLEARPRNLRVSPGQTSTITVQPASGSLPRGEYRGTLTLLYDDGSPSQVVNVLLLVTPAAGSSKASGLGPFHSETGGCAPTKLLTVHRTLGGGFVSPAGWPTLIEALVVDDCGKFVPDATVIAGFSSGDPSLLLTSLRNGTYTGVWRPLRAAGNAIVTVRANLPPLAPAEMSVQGGVSTNPLAPTLFSGGLVNAASFAGSSVLAPGSIVSVFGANLAGGTLQVGGYEAPSFYSGGSQINAQLPFELAPNTRPQAFVRGPDFITLPETITVAAARPGVFTNSQTGQGQGVIVDVENRLVDAAAPAAAGDVVVVYCTGLGPTEPAVPSGRAAPADPLARVITPLKVSIGDREAAVRFAGLTPGFVGLYQVNVEVPAGVAPGSAVPLVLLQDGVSSNTVTMAVH